MLRPENRNLLLEAMRPPAGYSLDQAIGTTFTLDLLSLLVTPLAFTFFDWEDRRGRPTADPLALLQALRRNADRIHLFCQVGMIEIPPPDKILLAYLEGSVIEVEPPRAGGLFHPKVWLLRFVSQDDEPVIYRLLCLSRNLTFARSWDTVLTLDGEVANRKRAYARNHPLGDFIAALPRMAIRRPGRPTQQVIDRMADEVRRVDFQPPGDFHDLAFWPIGLDGRTWPFPDSGSRFLVMSPFVTGGFLERLQGAGELQYLISRTEALEQLPQESLERIGECFVMDSGADLDAQDGDADLEIQDGAATAADDDQNAAELTGLHAKLFMMDEGFGSRIWTGSANATDAAFRNNVEFLVELRGGKRTKIGAFLGGEEDQHTLRALLMPYLPGEDPEEEDNEAQRLQTALNSARQRIIDLSLRAAVEKTDEDLYSITLQCRDERLWESPSGLTTRTWPITLRAGEQLEPDSPTAAVFTNLSFEALTAFFAFEIAVDPEHNLDGVDEVPPIRFVLRLPLHGEPEDRKERILQSLLRDRDQVMRLLLLLLAGEGISASDFVDVTCDSAAGSARFGSFGTATLLESLLKALDRDPAALDEVHRIITDLGKTPEGEKLIPEGLEEIWGPIWEARSEADE